MEPKQPSWWQKVNQHRMWSAVIIVASVLLIALVVVVVLGYWLNWSWVGVGSGNNTITTTTTATEQPPAKTLWDWLQLFIVPLALAVIALLFNRATTRTEQKIASDHYEQDKQIALDKQREDLLQAYLDRMSDLLLEKELRTSERDAEVRNVARARTLTVLPQLNAQRQRNLLQFLSESKLLEIINLRGANLSYVDLRLTNLSGANLNDADLRGANLIRADLNGAHLSYAILSGAHMIEADLSDADLRGAKLNYADLEDADLRGANLEDANVTEEQLKKAKSLKGATMPDGSLHP